MLRSARLDAPGVLHHVIMRGIERKKIFRDSTDQDDFLSRLDSNSNFGLKPFLDIRLLFLVICFGSITFCTMVLNLYSLSWLRWKQVFGANGGSP